MSRLGTSDLDAASCPIPSDLDARPTLGQTAWHGTQPHKQKGASNEAPFESHLYAAYGYLVIVAPVSHVGFWKMRLSSVWMRL